MTALRLAWRNLRRNKRRTTLTAIALIVGLCMFVISRALLDGVDSQSINNLINYDVSHLKAFAAEYKDQEFPSLDYVIENSSDVLTKLPENPRLYHVTPRLEVPGQLIAGSDETFVNVVGVAPQTDSLVFRTLDEVVEGEPLRENSTGVLIGDRLAAEMEISVNDPITLFVRSAPGALNPRRVVVQGILKTGHPQVDQFSVYMNLSEARNIALLPDGSTEIAFRFKNRRIINRLQGELSKTLPTLDWRNWKDLAADFLALAKLKRVGSGISIGVLLMMAAVGMANTMIMAVHERTREIGALRAMGFSKKLINQIFLFEGVLIGLLAGIAAILLAVFIIKVFMKNGISLEAYGNQDIGYPIRDVMMPSLTMKNLLSSFGFGFFFSILASWGAAQKAANCNIIRALRDAKL